MMTSKNAYMNNTDTIKRNFSRYAGHYDAYADVQRNVAENLISLLDASRFHKILDIGCGTGNYTQLLQHKFPTAHITAVDISQKMVSVAKSKMPSDRLTFTVADAQKITFAESFDLITSNACFHWFDDLDCTLDRYENILRPDGSILFSVFGPKTFYQLSESLRSSYGKDIPISANSFLNADRIEEILEKYFDRVCVRQQFFEKTYPSLPHLLKTIKYTGTRGLGISGVRPGKQRIIELEKLYKEKFGAVTATYHIFFCRAEKRN